LDALEGKRRKSNIVVTDSIELKNNAHIKVTITMTDYNKSNTSLSIIQRAIAISKNVIVLSHNVAILPFDDLIYDMP
jgi:hypothetical protein